MERYTSILATRAGTGKGDLVIGRRPSAVATLVERSIRTFRLVRLDGIKGPDARAALVHNLRGLSSSLLRSITRDRGSEKFEHERVGRELGIRVYFCDPPSPWQEGSNERTDRLLHQYLPKTVHSA